MALYCYVKRQPKIHRRNYSGAKTVISKMLAAIGLFLIGWVSYPIVSFELVSRFRYSNTETIAKNVEQNAVWQQINKKNEEAKPNVLSAEAYAIDAPNDDPTQIDYTKINNWFPNAPQSQMSLQG